MLNNRQKEVSDSLRRIDPCVAELFEGAVRVLNDEDFPIEAKVRFVAHAGREICTRLPAIVSGEEFKIFSYSEEVKEINELLEAEGLKDWKYTKDFGESEQSKDKISVSPVLIEKVQKLCQGHENIPGTRRRKAEALIKGLVPENQENPEAIIPLINEFKGLEGFFQKQAHVREKSTEINIPELQEKFNLLEAALYSLCGYYYSGYEEIRIIVDQANSASTEPNSAVVNKAIVAMGTPQFYRYFFENLKNPSWMDALKKKGYFDNPPKAEKEDKTVSYRYWPQGKYLVAVAGEKPEKVFNIIKDIDTDNILVMRDCLQALGKMPVNIEAQGMALVRRILNKMVGLDWFYVGKTAEELMLRLAKAEKWDEAFEIAKLLLKVNIKDDKYFRGWDHLEGRFDAYYYGELVSKYIKNLWEDGKQSLKTGRLLVEILDSQIEKDQKEKDRSCKPEERFEVTEHSYIMMPPIDAVEKGHPDIADILVGAIRTIGEHLMKNDPGEAEKYIAYLQSKKRSLYKRIIIHLHRYAPDNDKWKQRIRSIIRETKNVENYNTANEYKNLLHDKYEILSDEDKASFFAWVEKRSEIVYEEDFQKWYQESYGRRAEENDIEKYQNYLRAKELYCIKDKERKYQEYLTKSEQTDKAFKAWIGGFRTYSPAAPEFSPLSPEEMKEKAPKEVIKYILEYDSSHDDKEEFSEEDGHRINRKAALETIFKQDVVSRTEEYIEVDVDMILELSAPFMRDFFFGLDEALNNKKIENPDWDKILDVMNKFVSTRGLKEESRAASEVIPLVLERGFKVETCKLPVRQEALDIVWEILTRLLKYPEAEDIAEGEDALSYCINCPPGVAFGSIVRFGLFCKNENKVLFESNYAKEFREMLQSVLDEGGLMKVKCVFGVFFTNLCWMDEQWVKDNLDRIFSEGDQQKWGIMWKSYVKWSQPSELSFAMAKDKYMHAVNMIKEEIKDDGEESYNKRLMEHIMLAYWQGWTGIEENGVVRQLLVKMDDKMRARACHWLSTGFEYLKKHEDDNWRRRVVQRMHEYGGWRYAEMKKDPPAHTEEAREFTGWVKDSPFDKEETLTRAEKAVGLAGGVAVRMRDVGDFVEGVCAIAEGQELRVLLLLQKAINDPDVERWAWEYERVREQITPFMDNIVELQDDYPEVKKIRQAAIKVADSLGRFGFEYLRPHYAKLMRK